MSGDWSHRPPIRGLPDFSGSRNLLYGGLL